MASGINAFRTGFSGTRPNRFRVDIFGPGGNLNNLEIYVKATSAPGSSIGVIPTPWMGRVIKFSGERTYADWTIQVYDSSVSSENLRNYFEEWIEIMDGRDTHNINYKKTGTAEVKWNDIASSTGVGVHDSQTNFNSVMTLVNCFPIDISAMELSYDAVDTFAEFTITLAYDYHENSST
jgi:hypothetical protein